MKKTLPDWSDSEPAEIPQCNIHPYINSFLISGLLLAFVVFFSTHWDMDVNIPIMYSFIIVSQKAHTTVAYPSSRGIPNIRLNHVVRYTTCCMSKARNHVHCLPETTLHQNAKGEVSVAVHVPMDVQNLYCVLTVITK